MTNQEAIEILRGILTEAIEFENSVCYVTEEDREPLEMAIESLKNQNIGHWIEQENGNMLTYHRYKCSVCGGKRTGETGDWIQIHECKYPYCPDCGAKMIEPQKSEKINCKITKCENCINHNYCDFESQKRKYKE